MVSLFEFARVWASLVWCSTVYRCVDRDLQRMKLGTHASPHKTKTDGRAEEDVGRTGRTDNGRFIHVYTTHYNHSLLYTTTFDFDTSWEQVIRDGLIVGLISHLRSLDKLYGENVRNVGYNQ